MCLRSIQELKNKNLKHTIQIRYKHIEMRNIEVNNILNEALINQNYVNKVV